MANNGSHSHSAFEARHPWGLADGRRFASLYVAAETVAMAGIGKRALRLLPVTDHRTGAIYSMRDLALLMPENPRGQAVAVPDEEEAPGGSAACSRGPGD